VVSDFSVLFSLPRLPIVRGRFPFLSSRCAGKRVLHLGCVDSGLLDQRFGAGQLMHQQLAHTATELWGVDIDAPGVAYLAERGVPNVVVGDVYTLEHVDALRGRTFDVVLASEILEHLLNPGLFLKSVGALMVPETTELILTLPNAFSLATLLRLLDNVETVHPDHNFWFSYRTAVTLVSKCNLRVCEAFVYSFEAAVPPAPGSAAAATSDKGTQAGKTLRRPIAALRALPRRLLVRFLLARSAFWGDGLILVCRKPAEP
jgi:hypothetical protein